MREKTVRAFQDYIRPLESVMPFKYLGRIMMALDNDWPEVVGNLRNLRKIWAHMLRLLGRERENPRASGIFFKVVVQAVLFFGAAMWVMTPRTSPYLEGIQHRAARRITGKHTRKLL